MSDEPDISHLDFETKVECEILYQPWVHATSFLGTDIERPLASVPRKGPCPHPAKTVVSWRVCPCVADLRIWRQRNPDATQFPQTIGGLAIVPVTICDEHLRYFMEYVKYPFICSGCGVAFLHPGEVLLDGSDIFDKG
ncbi:hypothetical protein SEA_GUYFAGIERI_53 [Rhodococcus phage GuyFagieri]|nr:hypothetical protein SEA_GUYFAGIERI_53 [Rhodococcus phage GuyFagieri]